MTPAGAAAERNTKNATIQIRAIHRRNIAVKQNVVLRTNSINCSLYSPASMI